MRENTVDLSSFTGLGAESKTIDVGSRSPEFQTVDVGPQPSSLVVIDGHGDTGLARDWAAALNKVEKAADTIQEYQRKFVTIEKEAKSYFERVGDERRICHERIEILEAKLVEAENRAVRAEAEARASKLTQWQLRNDNRDCLKRCEQAELELRRSSAYIKRIEELLNGV